MERLYRWYKIVLALEGTGVLLWGSLAIYNRFLRSATCESAAQGNSHVYLNCYSEQSAIERTALTLLTLFLLTLLFKKARLIPLEAKK